MEYMYLDLSLSNYDTSSVDRDFKRCKRELVVKLALILAVAFSRLMLRVEKVGVYTCKLLG